MFSITPVKTRPTPGISGSLVDPRLVQVDVEEDEESLVSQTTFETPKSAKSMAKIHKKMEDKVLENLFLRWKMLLIKERYPWKRMET